MRLGKRQRTASDGWVSVLFHPTGVEVAQVRRPSGQRPQVLVWEVYDNTGDRGSALKRLRGGNRLGAAPCTTLLGYGKYQLLQMEAPAVPAEERADALRWKIKEMVDFPVEQAGVQVLDIPMAAGALGRAPQLYVVAAGNGVLAPLIQSFQGAKVPLAAIDIPELAQRNVAALFEEQNRGLALLVFGPEGGCLTFTYQGELYVARRIEVRTPELVAAAAQAGGGLYERILLDVQRSMDNFDRNYSFITLSRLLVTPVPGAESFVDFLRENLFQPVEVLDLAQGLDIGAVPALADPGHQATALLAIGAALRDVPS